MTTTTATTTSLTAHISALNESGVFYGRPDAAAVMQRLADNAHGYRVHEDLTAPEVARRHVGLHVSVIRSSYTWLVMHRLVKINGGCIDLLSVDDESEAVRVKQSRRERPGPGT